MEAICLAEAAAAGERTVEARILNILEFFWSARVPLTGNHNSGRVEHLGWRQGQPDLQRH
jgi:hypothetical protein